MKTNIFSMMMAFAVISICSCNETGESEHNDRKDTTNSVSAAAIAQDPTGAYEGTTPCADCDGITVNLALNKDQTYRRTLKYLGTSDNKPAEENGKWTLDATTNTVTLDGITDGPSKYMMEAGNLVQLDMEGKKIEGGTAAMYILKKN